VAPMAWRAASLSFACDKAVKTLDICDTLMLH
jgi:hypothetical protein